VAVVWTLPLAFHLSTHLPGTGLGDNASFLWNFWWMREALAHQRPFFETTYLFAPLGADLTLHTHTAFPALVGATALGRAPLVAALNATILLSVALNGFCAYLLAWRLTRDRVAAIGAGFVFGCSPFIAAHLAGHFNLVTAWTIPLFAIACLDAVEGSLESALFAGAILALTAYVDYYFLLFQLAFAGCLYVWRPRSWALSLRPSQRRSREWALIVVGSFAALDAAIIGWIVLVGGFSWRLGSITIGMHELFNPVQILGILAALAAVAYARPSIQRDLDRLSLRRARIGLIVLLTASGLLVSPVAWRLARVIMNGEYVSQQYFWRSSPPGIDLATLVLGNPFHAWWGEWVQGAYARLGIDLVESTGWLGVIPLALAVYAFRSPLRAHPHVRFWTIVFALFFVWALGSHLLVAGRNTALLLPAALRQFVPVLSNARMPGRAMVMAYLAIAMLAAFGLAELRRQHSRVVAGGAVALIAFEFWTAPCPVAAVACPSIYETLRARPEQGALAELPLGIGDGFGNVTRFDNRAMLACQPVHGRPLVGGFMARLSPRVLAAYRADPLLSEWMRLSGAGEISAVPTPPPLLADRLHADRIAFILLDQRAASESLRQSVDSLPVTRIAADDRRVLYVVDEYAR